MVFINTKSKSEIKIPSNKTIYYQNFFYFLYLSFFKDDKNPLSQFFKCSKYYSNIQKINDN